MPFNNEYDFLYDTLSTAIQTDSNFTITNVYPDMKDNYVFINLINDDIEEVESEGEDGIFLGEYGTVLFRIRAYADTSRDISNLGLKRTALNQLAKRLKKTLRSIIKSSETIDGKEVTIVGGATDGIQFESDLGKIDGVVNVFYKLYYKLI